MQVRLTTQEAQVPLVMAMPGLVTTHTPIAEGSSYALSMKVHADGFLYLLYELPDGQIELIPFTALLRRKGRVRKGETIRFPRQSAEWFSVDETGNRDALGILFTSSPQKRRMLTRSVNTSPGSFSNKVQSVHTSANVTYRAEEQFIALSEHPDEDFKAVILISIDKK